MQEKHTTETAPLFIWDGGVTSMGECDEYEGGYEDAVPGPKLFPLFARLSSTFNAIAQGGAGRARRFSSFTLRSPTLMFDKTQPFSSSLMAMCWFLMLVWLTRTEGSSKQGLRVFLFHLFASLPWSEREGIRASHVW